MEHLINSTHSHKQESKAALVVLLLAVTGFLIYFVMGSPVDQHNVASKIEHRMNY